MEQISSSMDTAFLGTSTGFSRIGVGRRLLSDEDAFALGISSMLISWVSDLTTALGAGAAGLTLMLDWLADFAWLETRFVVALIARSSGNDLI